MQCHKAQPLGFADSLDKQLTILVQRFVWLRRGVPNALRHDCSLGHQAQESEW
jgi:hypothetical protein